MDTIHSANGRDRLRVEEVAFQVRCHLFVGLIETSSSLFGSAIFLCSVALRLANARRATAFRDPSRPEDDQAMFGLTTAPTEHLSPG